MNERAEALAAELRAEGIDPAHFLAYGPSAAEGLSEEPAERVRALEALRDLARGLHAASSDSWTPFCFGATALAEACRGEPGEFVSLLNSLEALVLEVRARGMNEAAGLQRGMQALGHVAAGQAPLATAALELALQLAREGIDPGETLHLGIEAAAGVAGEDLAAFSTILAALRELLETLDACGVTAHWPLYRGIQGLAAACPGEPERFEDGLRELSDLVLSLRAQGVSPHPVLEYGVRAAWMSAGTRPWLRDAIFPLASLLACQGRDPQILLQFGLPALATRRAEEGAELLAFARELADEGIDPGLFLQHGGQALCVAVSDSAERVRLLGRVAELHRALHTRGIRPLLTFQYGLPRLCDFHLEDVLELALAVAAAGIDPGPELEHGLAATRAHLVGRPQVTPGVFALAHEQLAAGERPWPLLEYGIPALALAAGPDDQAFRELLPRLARLLRDLQARGGESGSLLHYVLWPVAKRAQGAPQVFAAFLERVAELSAALDAAGLQVQGTLSRGLPEVARAAQGAPAVVEAAFALAHRFIAAGLDPGDALARALPALLGAELDPTHLGRLLDALLAAWAALAPLDPTTAPDALVLAAARACDERKAAPQQRAAALESVLETAARLAEEGLDASVSLARGAPGLIAAWNPADLPGALAALAACERRCAPLDPDQARAWALPALTRLARGRGATFARLLDALEALLRSGLAPEDRRAVLDDGSRAAASVANGKVEAFLALWEALGARARARRTEGEDPGPGLSSITLAARVAGNTPELFHAVLDAWQALGRLSAWRPRLPALRGLLDVVAGGSARAMTCALADLEALDAEGALRGVEEATVERLEGLRRLLARLPAAWDRLIIPVARSQRAATPRALLAIQRLARYLHDGEGLALLRQISTQHGVRALDVFEGFLRPALWRGELGSLGREREQVLAFLRDLPLAVPDAYPRYRKLMEDPARTPAERRAAVATLRADLDALTASVIAGEPSEAQLADPLLGAALYHVFPPALGVGREAYARLVRTFPDLPEHVARLDARGRLQGEEAQLVLAQAGLRVRADAQLELQPWETLRGVVETAQADTRAGPPRTAAELGRALFDAWSEGRIAKPEERRELLQAIYRYARHEHGGLPRLEAQPATLVAYRDFLADTALEIVQEALQAHRSEQPERFLRRARLRLGPRRRVGRGLVRVVQSTVAAFQAGRVTRDAAGLRLRRQLADFELGDPDAFLGLEPAALAVRLGELTPAERELAVDGVHERVLQDLVGADLAAMQRELFGEGAAPGKLESCAAGGEALVVRVGVTKRRAHAPVGFAAGVCTARDRELWSQERFIPAVLWGPDALCWGGLHLLLCQDGGAEHLVLPGINPALRLLERVPAEVVLEAVLAWAARLAASWGLRSVWIPRHGAICSNRPGIRQALQARELPLRSIGAQEFGVSPYCYTFSEVWVAWAPE